MQGRWQHNRVSRASFHLRRKELRTTRVSWRITTTQIVGPDASLVETSGAERELTLPDFVRFNEASAFCPIRS